MIYHRISVQTHDKLLAALGHGQANARHGDEIAAETGIDPRSIKKILEEWHGVFDDGTRSYAVAGHPTHGYYLIETDEEWDDELRRMRTRALKQLARLSALKRARRRRPLEQPQQPPLPDGYQFPLVA